MEGGYASKTYRVRTSLGRSVIVKTQTDLPPDLYARGSRRPRRTPGPGRVRRTRSAPGHADFIVLTDLGASAPSPTYWEDAGRALALQHQHTADKFGYHQDNYLGVLPQRNPWTTDGHSFFAEHRLLRYLEVPNCYNALSPTTATASNASPTASPTSSPPAAVAPPRRPLARQSPPDPRRPPRVDRPGGLLRLARSRAVHAASAAATSPTPSTDAYEEAPSPGAGLARPDAAPPPPRTSLRHRPLHRLRQRRRADPHHPRALRLTGSRLVEVEEVLLLVEGIAVGSGAGGRRAGDGVVGGGGGREDAFAVGLAGQVGLERVGGGGRDRAFEVGAVLGAGWSARPGRGIRPAGTEPGRRSRVGCRARSG